MKKSLNGYGYIKQCIKDLTHFMNQKGITELNVGNVKITLNKGSCAGNCGPKCCGGSGIDCCDE